MVSSEAQNWVNNFFFVIEARSLLKNDYTLVTYLGLWKTTQQGCFGNHERWIDQYDTSVGQRKIWIEIRSGTLSTELRELMESKVI